MNILEIIAKKRDKKSLTKEEIEYFIEGYTNGSITDYQASALVMAIYINGMNDERKVLFPIHRDHINQNLNLKQNPGY